MRTIESTNERPWRSCAGPWDSEPDKKQWQDPFTGLPCLLVRNPVGALCGYVGVPAGHPWHGLGYDNDDLYDVEVHGGLTYSGRCAGGICHVVEPDEDDDVWWLGFDAAHSGDLCPSMLQHFPHRPSETYRDQEYMERWCARLARQVRAADA